MKFKWKSSGRRDGGGGGGGGDGGGGGGKQVAEDRRGGRSRRENVNTMETPRRSRWCQVEGSIFKEDGVLRWPLHPPSYPHPRSLPPTRARTLKRTRKETHLHKACSLVATPLGTQRSMKWSSPLLPLLLLSLARPRAFYSLSLSVCLTLARTHAHIYGHIDTQRHTGTRALSATVPARSPTRYFRKIKRDKEER